MTTLLGFDQAVLSLISCRWYKIRKNGAPFPVTPKRN